MVGCIALDMVMCRGSWPIEKPSPGDSLNVFNVTSLLSLFIVSAGTKAAGLSLPGSECGRISALQFLK